MEKSVEKNRTHGQPKARRRVTPYAENEPQRNALQNTSNRVNEGEVGGPDTKHRSIADVYSVHAFFLVSTASSNHNFSGL